MEYKISEANLHPHLRARMKQRGVSLSEMQRVMTEGWEVGDAKPGTMGKIFVFPYNAVWESQFYLEKEVTVYYKVIAGELVLLTVMARYGQGFPKKEV